MSMYKVFDISGSGLKAQSLRLTTTASNLSNANVAAPNEQSVFRARYPIFSSSESQMANSPFNKTPGVEVDGVFLSNRPALKEYQPDHPLADGRGYIYKPNVNVVEEMTNMISASKGYRINLEVLNTSKELMSRTLQLGQ